MDASAVDGIYNPQKLVLPVTHPAAMVMPNVINAPVIEIDDDELDENKQALNL